MSGKPPQGVPCEVKAQLQMLEPGVLQIATFNVPTLKLDHTVMVLNLKQNRLEFRARCGCFVEVPFTPLLQGLADMSHDHAPVLQ